MRLGIAGLGLIGGSLALAARAAGYQVGGFDRDPGAVALAFERGAIDEAVPTLEALGAFERVAIALPVDATLAVLASPALRDVALLFDVASVKEPIAAAAADRTRFIGSHPIAGREIGGMAAADAALFRDRAWAVVPGAPQAQLQLEALIRAIGAHVVVVEASRHDRILALTSHAPQVLAVLLGDELAARSDQDPLIGMLCGPAILGMLRTANSPVATWTPIVSANSRELASLLRVFGERLTESADALDRGESAPILSLFARAGRATGIAQRSQHTR